MDGQIVVLVSLDERTFKRFSRFDTFALRRRWVRPAAFAAILTALANDAAMPFIHDADYVSPAVQS